MKKRVIVCGASSGIGRAAALALSKTDCELVLAARRRVLLDELVSQCQANGATAVGIPCDITQFLECEALIKEAKALGPAEPVLINSAGVAEFGDFASTPVASIEGQIHTNLLGPLFACRAAVPWMLEVGQGHIVNVLSISASLVFPGAAVYSASKAGLLMFGRILAAEYRKQGVRVTTVLPGATDTPIWNVQTSAPSREDMLTPEAVAEVLRDVILLPSDRNVDEITIMPPKGVL